MLFPGRELEYKSARRLRCRRRFKVSGRLLARELVAELADV